MRNLYFFINFFFQIFCPAFFLNAFKFPHLIQKIFLQQKNEFPIPILAKFVYLKS